MSEHGTTTTPYGELMAHEYDGIREYDNPTPGWWHAIFLATILLCLPYIAVYHMSPLPWSPQARYETAVAEHFRRQFAKFGDLQGDGATIAGLAASPEYMNAVSATFISKCASCHGKNGEGLVGPNLTDDHYKNVKSLADLYNVISEGVVAKGMPAWKIQIPQVERVLLAAYVATLRGTDAPGRAPEGDVIPPFPTAEPLRFGGETATEG